MMSEHTKKLIISFLEMFEEEFGAFLEDFHEVEPTEAGVIIDWLKGKPAVIEPRGDDDLYEKFVAEFAEMENHPGIELRLDAMQGWAIFSAIQLACRHPLFQGPTRQMVEAIARRLQEVVAQTPALKAIAEMRCPAKYDVPVADEKNTEGEN